MGPAVSPTISRLNIEHGLKDLILLPDYIDINVYPTSTFKHGLSEDSETIFSSAKKFKKETSNKSLDEGILLTGCLTPNQNQTQTENQSVIEGISSGGLEEALNTNGYEINPIHSDAPETVENTPSNDVEFDLDSIISCPESPFLMSEETPIDTGFHFSSLEDGLIKSLMKREDEILSYDIQGILEDELSTAASTPNLSPLDPLKVEPQHQDLEKVLVSQNIKLEVEKKENDQVKMESDGVQPAMKESTQEELPSTKKLDSFDSLSPQAVRLLCILDLENGEQLPKKTETTSKSESVNAVESSSDIYIRALPYLIDSYGEIVLETLDVFGFGIVHYAAIEGLVDVLQSLDKKGLSKHLHLLDQRGHSVLALAVLFKKYETVGFLLEKGFSASQTNYNGDSVLKLAVEVGDAKLLGSILSKSKCVNDQDIQGKTALHCASSMGRKDLVELLIKHGASTSKKDCWGTTPLITAVMLGYHDFLNILTKDKSVLHLTDIQGKTALHWAAAVGNISAAEFLLAQGAKIETRDKKGRTPFLLAAFSQQFNMIRFLRDKNANKDVKDNEGREANFLAIL